VTSAGTGYKGTLGWAQSSPPAACGVGVRYIAQVSRTGASDAVFGQLVSAYEMASKTGLLVGVNLSSPEDDSSSLANYDLHMAMLDFLYNKYTVTHASPLHVTLHAGELVPQYLPTGSTDNTFHVRHAVETGHAERIGHGVDVMSETNADQLLTEMHDDNVLVEVCLSSNTQILDVAGTAHPLAQYLAHGVPVALATDDQGVSRSSMAGEYTRAALDQHLTYRQLKLLARQSLEHSFLPGASLWTSIADATPVAACASTATMGVGDPATGDCKAVLDGSEKAAMQWELERRFRLFESMQPAK
jgi:adenosine deaminase